MRQTIKTLFLLQKSQTVIDLFLNSQVKCDLDIDESWFVRAYLDDVSPIRTKDQVESIYALLCSKWMRENDGIKSFSFAPTPTVFNVLLHFSADMLREYANEPVCRYESLLRWHDLTSLVGEDLLTTSYFAAKDLKQGIKRTFFNWKDIVSHDNAALNNVFSKRMIDLHYHLYGSIFVFDLNWLSLMNDVAERKECFQEIQQYLNPSHVISVNERNVSLYHRVIKAAAIRLLLFWYIDGSLSDRMMESLYDATIDLLASNEDVWMESGRQPLQQRIQVARLEKGYVYENPYLRQAVLDYAISDGIMVNSSKDKEYLYTVLSGERHLMYSMFRKIYGGECNSLMATCFYIYLLIKGEFRSEIVQLNDSVGFANFSDYQGRKYLFLKKGSVYDAIAPQIAIASSLSDRQKWLEARITPCDSYRSLGKFINKIEDSVNKGLLTFDISDRLRERYSIILHFIKNGDSKMKRLENKNMFPRHYTLRKKIKKESLALSEWRSRCMSQGRPLRIVGVDAASSEIACRPEVFGQGYRFLKNFHSASGYCKDSHELGFTFHVGEDFLDIVDGLRAIRESLIFLNLENRDRIGHALVLGTDIEKYYMKRGYYVSMTKQMLLDNIVWLYFEGFTCVGFNKIAVHLKAQFEKYFNEIYAKSIAQNKNAIFSITIEDYYQSWFLRGDDPHKYMNPNSLDESLSGFYDLYAFNERAEVREARSNPKACYLYYLYHYDNMVYDEGSKSEQIKLNEDMIFVIKQLQSKLLSEIERLHISIETNPTSNYRIGDFDRYDEHPILQFFNYGLNHEGTDEHSVTVSINTDDKGVFSTSLEREFSVMAAALEKKCDIGYGGNSPRMIYDWLDRIREMAFEMEF